MKKIFKVLRFIPLLVIAMMAFVAGRFYMDAQNPYPDIRPDANTLIPKFTEVPLDFTHVYQKSNSLPFMASAVIDLDNDGVEGKSVV